ncbi:hypothetical protein ACOSP7_018799 [Xanthoceras sorbifolium]
MMTVHRGAHWLGMGVGANLHCGMLRSGPQQRSEVFSSACSVVTKADLKLFVRVFTIPKGYKLLTLSMQDKAVYPPPGYVLISHQHLQVGLRLPFPRFLIDILNLLTLAPLKLSPNSYSKLISLYLMFSRHGIPPRSDNINRFCFSLKKNPIPKNVPDGTLYNGIYYLSVRAHQYKKLLSDTKSNLGSYKISYFIVTRG